MSREFQVKGSSIRSKFEFVRERFGDAAERRLATRFGDRPELEPLLDSAMYPFTVYDELLRIIAEECYDGDLERLTEVGAYSARQVLTGVYRAFAAGKDFAGFLEHASVLHGRFYSAGQMSVDLAEDGRRCEIRLTGAPVYSEADLQVAAGFYAGAAELLGIEQLDWQLSWDQSGATYELRWR